LEGGPLAVNSSGDQLTGILCVPSHSGWLLLALQPQK
jgi:hypothetical protein